ncbi:MAG: CocE/NonD family hydrolase [Alphaproteobacteria bacterium]|nr:CocE/NonD family hydrolase [Alphaproteobacteria bacterium]
MSDSARGSNAWRMTPADYLATRPKTAAGGIARRSLHVAMRDGVRLAVDVHLPEASPPGTRHPTVVLFTPYYRRFRLADGAPARTEASPSYAVYRDFFVPYGYAVVIVDVRGTGASFGARIGFRSPEERLDYHDTVDWIARQPWSDGRVGITGISYVGAAADFAASTGHPAIRAVMPTFSVWDTWGDMFYPGGLLYIGMIGGYGRMIEALDLDRRDVLQEFAYFAGPHYAGPAPVDDDADGTQVTAAIAEHAANFDTTAFVTQLTARDGVFGHDPDFGAPTVAPRTYMDGIDPTLPHYGVSGWMDGAGYTNAATARFRALRNTEKRLLLGPWDHGARTNVSPGRDGPRPRFEMHAEMLRFFDQHVAGIETGLADEPPVRYFTMIEEKWKAAAAWPPPAAATTLFLAADGALAAAAPASDGGADAYRTDHAIGTGSHTRYERIAGQPVEEYYPDWHGRDARMATWTGPVLERATEVTGHPVARIWLASEARDAAVILYLEDVAPDGRTRYVTEGMLRARYRGVAPAPANYAQVGPWHPCGTADAAPLEPGVPALLEIALMPTSWLFGKGHRVRLALAAADRDHLARLPFGRSPVLTVFRNRERPSSLTLPVMPRT